MKTSNCLRAIRLTLLLCMLLLLFTGFPQADASELEAESTTRATQTVQNGVYRIISKSANLSIGTSGHISNLTNVATKATATQYAGQFFQFWKITHLGNNLYSIRPMYKLDMALDVSGTNVDVYKIGYTDSLNAVPSYAQWTIESTANGYVFKKGGLASQTMMAASSGTSADINICVGTYSSSSALCHFTLTKIDPVPGSLMLFSTTSDYLYVSNFASDVPVVSTGLGGTKTMQQIGFIPSVCDAYFNSQVLYWISNNPSVATIDVTTGAITPVSMGETLIEATHEINGQSYTVKFMLVVTIPDGTYFINSKSSGLYADIYGQNMANGTVIHQWAYHGGNTQRWVFTNNRDGTFTIHSANATSRYYLGVSGDSTANDQPIVLRTGTVTNGMKWKVELTSSGAYKLTPLTGEANNRVLALEVGILGIANSSGDVIQQRDYEDDTNYKDEWYLYQNNKFNIDIHFDTSYQSRVGSNANAVAEVNSQAERLRNLYLSKFNIDINFTTPTHYSTYANLNCTTSPTGICNHGNCSNSLGFLLSQYHHTNFTNILLRLPRPTATTHAKILYIGHSACAVVNGVHSSHPYNGLAYSDLCIIGVNNHNGHNDCTRTFVHEIGHLFGAPDHYGDGTGSAMTTEQVNSEYGTNIFNDRCIYGLKRFEADVVNNLIMCPGCEKQIKNNSNKFHDAT